MSIIPQNCQERETEFPWAPLCVKGICLSHVYSWKHVYSLRHPGLSAFNQSTHCSKGKCSSPQSPCSLMLCSQLTAANIKIQLSVYFAATALLCVHLQHFSEWPHYPVECVCIHFSSSSHRSPGIFCSYQWGGRAGKRMKMLGLWD